MEQILENLQATPNTMYHVCVCLL